MKTDASLLRQQAIALRAVAAALDAQASASEAEPERDPLVGADEVGIDRVTWRRVIRSGELPGALIGREYRARRSDVARWVESRRVQPRVGCVLRKPRTRACAAPANDEGGDELERLLRRHRAGARA